MLYGEEASLRVRRETAAERAQQGAESEEDLSRTNDISGTMLSILHKSIIDSQEPVIDNQGCGRSRFASVAEVRVCVLSPAMCVLEEVLCSSPEH